MSLLLDEFAGSFALADYVIVTDVYPAGELPIEGINGKTLYDKIKKHSDNKLVHFLPKEEIVSHILKIIEPYDLLITLGAGDSYKICDELVEKLKR